MTEIIATIIAKLEDFNVYLEEKISSIELRIYYLVEQKRRRK